MTERRTVPTLLIVLVAAAAATVTIVHAGMSLLREKRSPPPRFTSVSAWAHYAEAGIREGSAEAGINVVVFLDFECPACRAFDSILTAIQDDYPDQVALVFRHLPLRYHAMAMSAATAGECAAAQGVFARYRRLVFELQDSLVYVAWSRLARRAGVPDIEAFRKCMAEEQAAGRIREDIEAAGRLGVRGVPGVLVNDRLYFGAPTAEELVAEIERSANRRRR